jgi:hypothetical protein
MRAISGSGVRRMCILCEEPFRSVLIGLAAIGLIVIGRAIWRLIAQRAGSMETVT